MMQRDRIIVVVFATAVLVSGCGKGTTTANKTEKSRLKPFVVLYTSATSALRRPPTNEGEFKKYLESEKGRMLGLLHVENVDELFISERDGQPYVVNYGPAAAGKGEGVIAYEKVGVDGKRMVGYATGIVVELDEEHFRDATAK